MQELEQEKLDEAMIGTGSVPVQSLPSVANGEGMWNTTIPGKKQTDVSLVKGKSKVQPEEEEEEEELKRLQAEMAM